MYKIQRPSCDGYEFAQHCCNGSAYNIFLPWFVIFMLPLNEFRRHIDHTTVYKKLIKRSVYKCIRTFILCKHNYVKQFWAFGKQLFFMILFLSFYLPINIYKKVLLLITFCSGVYFAVRKTNTRTPMPVHFQSLVYLYSWLMPPVKLDNKCTKHVIDKRHF